MCVSEDVFESWKFIKTCFKKDIEKIIGEIFFCFQSFCIFRHKILRQQTVCKIIVDTIF